MSTNISSRPRTIMLGVDDNSTRSVPVEEIVLPQHVPYNPFFGVKGDPTPRLLNGAGASKMHGADSFDVTSRFANHNTPFINLFTKNNNSGFYHRLIPPNAKTSMLRLSIEAIPNETPIYDRNVDGTIKYTYNDLNEKLPVILSTVVGQRLVAHVSLEGYGSSTDKTNPINYQDFAQGIVVRNYRPNTTTGSDGSSLGTITGSDNTYTSTLYPIFDLPVASPGSDGDNQGVRIQLPTSGSASPLDTASVYSSNSFLWRLGLVERDTVNGGFSVVQTVDGSTTVDVSLKLNARADRSGDSITIDTNFISRFVTAGTDTLPEFPAPFGDIHIYRDSIEELQNILISGTGKAVGEATYNDVSKLGWGRVPVTTSNPYLINFLGGYDPDGARYHTFSIADSANFGGVTITSDNVFYAQGGDDGLYKTASGDYDTLANAELFDQLVRDQLTNFGTGEVNWTNRAKYPVTTFWDSGYSIDTKKAMLTPLAYRKDVNIVLSPQSTADYVTKNVAGVVTKVWSWISDNTEATESSVLGTLRTVAAGYPESDAYGTGVCRVLIVGSNANIINSKYDRRVPLTYEVAHKVSMFMGASSGVWDGTQAFDVDKSIIEKMTNVSLTFKTDTVAEQEWANGLVYPQDYDTRRTYIPAIQTVYSNDTSVLHSAITMFAICAIQRGVDVVNRSLQGNSKWSQAKFIQQSNERVAKKLANIFDNRFIIYVDTVFTEVDKSLGYSWNTNVSIYSPTMKTVGSVTVVAERLDDFDSTTASGVMAATTTTN